MPTQIEFREIPIFRYFDSEARQHLIRCFTRMVKHRGDQLLSFGKAVPGIYIIVDGEVAVTVPKIEQHLALLHRGQSFGEMSLIESGETASANIIVSSSEVKLVFCSTADFQNLLQQVAGCAHAFYKGAAHLLSTRLRNVNTHISEEIAAGQQLIASMLSQSELGRHLSITRSEVNRTGDAVVGKLMQVMPTVDMLLQKYPTAQDLIQQLKTQLEEIFLIDAQNFDRISQQLDLILQHFENLKRVASGGSMLPVKGDQNLFSAAIKVKAS